MTIQYINRAAPFALDPAIALLGNEREGLALDFLNLRAYVRDRDTTANFFLGDPNDLLTYSSPSTKWIVNKSGVLESGTALRCAYDEAGNPLGVRIETQATRLNKYGAAPTAAENVTVTAQAYTISFYGGGQIVLSGAASQTITGIGASNRKSVTFTPSAGTLTLTPSGSVADLQLEVGSAASSVIRGDEGAQKTRAVDNVTLALSKLPWASSAVCVIADFDSRVVHSRDSYYREAFGITDGTNTNTIGFYRPVLAQNRLGVGSVGSSPSIVTIGASGRNHAVASVASDLTMRVSVNGGAPVAGTHAQDLSLLTTLGVGAFRAGLGALDGWMRSLVVIPRKPSDAEMQAWSAL